MMEATAEVGPKEWQNGGRCVFGKQQKRACLLSLQTRDDLDFVSNNHAFLAHWSKG
jgi:hypothetical protein